MVTAIGSEQGSLVRISGSTCVWHHLAASVASITHGRTSEYVFGILIYNYMATVQQNSDPFAQNYAQEAVFCYPLIQI